ncbi:serine--tRNA ligase [Aquiluna sp. KACHI24]|uniref:serine--tRNA ligase n=1 Tax=Aquiluna sp. KACHI24 TaxID=2968831 RepID=UPI00220DEBE3|nr:serine--tRNA ligase [Aquiluna sp. KACHI24]BDP99717.1 serine--tRNA ligase [Aquiluna sp. KACHI24]
MIDLNLLRENPEAIRASQRARGANVDLVDQAVELESQRRQSLNDFEKLRAEQNAHGKLVAAAPKEQKAELVAQAQELAAKVKAADVAAAAAQDELDQILLKIENVVIPDVPQGGEENFVVIKEVGTKPQFAFAPKEHSDLGEQLDIIDLARGAKISGSRFYFLKGLGARLELALMQLALDQATEAGFTALITPTLVRPEVMQGTGFLGEHSAEVYYLPADELFLTGTSEVALAGYHSDEILDDLSTPVRYAGWSTCYRREAGSHGKDTKGILRVHQFNKLEMFSYCRPEDAEQEHAKLLAWQEQMLQKCELPYRVIDVAAGDLGSSAARKYDIEAWVPSQQTYRELTSTSNCTTFQARRLNTRYRDESGKPKTAATLNGTLATTRWMVAILENHQQADGSVLIPQALRPYLGGIDRITPKA